MPEIKRWTVSGNSVLFDGKTIIRLESRFSYPDFTSYDACSLAFLYHAAERLAEQLNSDGAKP